MTASTSVGARIQRPDGVRRLGQALWMMVGQPVALGDLLWARGLLGADGDTLLWSALVENGVVREPDLELQPQELATFLCSLWYCEVEPEALVGLVWTLPTQLTVEGIAPDGYVQAAIRIVDSAKSTLTLVAPYLEPKGMGWLHSSLLGALQRGVTVVMLAHNIEDISSLASVSLEALRRESTGLSGSLTVFTASPALHVLLHLKIIVVDERKAIVGSANVTGKGFSGNLEVGVLLGSASAREICRVVQATVACGLVTSVYSSPRSH